jgi:hypothetical protein
MAPFTDPTFQDFTRRSPGSLPPLTLILSSGTQHNLATSRNASWLEDILKQGLPRFLMRKLLPASSLDHLHADGADEEFSYIYNRGWDETEEGKTVHKFIFFTNIRPSLGPSEEVMAKHAGHNLRPPARDMTRKLQIARARDQARATVYDMSYLRKSRCWGPFQPLESAAPQPVQPPIALYSSAWDDEDDGATSEARNQARGASSNASAPPAPVASTSSTLLGPDLQEDDMDMDFDPDDEDEDEDDDDILFHPDDEGQIHDMYYFPEYPHEVIPDYAYLHELRLVAMTNVKEKLLDNSPRNSNIGQEDLEAFNNIENSSAMSKVLNILDNAEVLRFGSMPEFWGKGWNMEDVLRRQEGQGKALQASTSNADDYTEGWDWAGVEGEWRYVSPINPHEFG